MSETKWTPEQRQVIRARDRDLLVSAAAGSGKTAVLVERIIRMLTDPDAPLDVDQLLVVTFTRAAAHEMKEKIRRAIQEAVNEARSQLDPTDRQKALLSHLQRQLTLVHSAQITTIDSFCAYVVRNHFNEIDLEPDFRIAEEGEIRLIAQEVMDQLMDEHYEMEDQAFIDLVDLYARRGKDDALADMLMSIYGTANADPWPMEWLDRCSDTYRVKSPEDMLRMPWVQGLTNRIKSQAEACEDLLEEAMQLSRLPGGPHYQEAIEADLAYCESIREAEDFSRIALILSGIQWKKLSGKRKGVDEELKARAKDLRDQSKKVFEQLRRDYSGDPAAEFDKLSVMAPYLKTLLDLTKEYAVSFEACKRKKNVVDFADLEHYALRILRDPADPAHPMTETAENLCRQYAEVMIDEYQDSNNLQEAILSAVAGSDQGKHKTFMVGDIKQSIYSFRQARPELFNSKLKSYDKLTAKSQKTVRSQRIDLSRNFRSRQEILDFANHIFYRVMQEDLGGVAYHEDVALHLGADYPATAEDISGKAEDPYSAELILCEQDMETLEALGLEDKAELEANMIGERIQRLMREQKVVNEEAEEGDQNPLRRLRYQDIVILLRSPGSNGQVFVDRLTQMGIPAHITSGKGYFDTVEVSRFLALLSLLNNRRDDRSLAAVMLSHVFGEPFTEDQLYLIRSAYPRLTTGQDRGDESRDIQNACLWESLEAMESYSRGILAGEKEDSDQRPGHLLELDTSLPQKVLDFCDRLEAARARIPYTPIHRLIEELLDETAYLNYVTALPGGQIRRANLLKLVDEAIRFEGSSYRGLYRFMNYIQKLRTYNVDMSAAELIGEEDDAVRITSIHKSKGLQYPVVFVCGLGQKFNMRDSSGDMLIETDLGISLRTRNAAKRTMSDSLFHRAVSDQRKENSLAEEMRVLYVALTRAKEKLILSGSLSRLKERLDQEWEATRGKGDGYVLPYHRRMGAKNYLDWILPSLASYGELYRQSIHCYIPGEDGALTWGQEQAESPGRADCDGTPANHLEDLKDLPGTEALLQYLRRVFAYRYPYSASQNYKSKYSVSEIKHASMQLGMGEKEGQEIFRPVDEDKYVPEFARAVTEERGQNNKKIHPGALRGTAMHRVMECLDFAREDYADSLGEQLDQMRADGRLSEEELGLVLPDRIQSFLKQDMADRIHRSAVEGRLYREQPFVMGLRPQEIDKLMGRQPSAASKESETDAAAVGEDMILVQGIIDLFFIEDGKIFLLDYKTDRVQDESELVGRYQAQLLLYAQAVLRAMSSEEKPLCLGGVCMYSFALGRLVYLDLSKEDLGGR